MLRLLIGHVSDSSAKIWVRGLESGKHVTLAINSENDLPIEANMVLRSEDFYTGAYEFNNLSGDTAYDVTAVFSDGVTENGAFTTFPTIREAPFSFIISSCNLKTIFTNEDKIFKRLHEEYLESNAKFMIHSGDQIYIDIFKPPKQPCVDMYRNKYTELWDRESAKTFFRSIPNYMILDDHEIANNFANDEDYGANRKSAEEYKRIGLKAYDEFQHSHNPTTEEGVYYYDFKYGDVAFFVLDCRSERCKNEGLMISLAQLEKFKSWLSDHKNDLKFVISPVPFVTRPSFKGMREDQWTGKTFQKQRLNILSHIQEEEIDNIFFLTGDMHSAVMSRLDLLNGCNVTNKIYEFMAGPLSQFNVNGPMFFDRNEKFEEDHPNYIYELNEIHSSSANALLITVDGNQVKYKWFAVQKNNSNIGDGCVEF